ncbi:MAG TPA: hypothetical protein DCR55_07090 [Lentisphaeria bacterium]|nr:hypothetical protein [Lentisphaeria bacterium]
MVADEPAKATVVTEHLQFLGTNRLPRFDTSMARKIPKRAGMKDVAQRAGVSMASVSRILNRDAAKFLPDTVERVRDAAKELNYRPNATARNLFKGSTSMAGVMVPTLDFYGGWLKASMKSCWTMATSCCTLGILSRSRLETTRPRHTSFTNWWNVLWMGSSCVPRPKSSSAAILTRFGSVEFR